MSLTSEELKNTVDEKFQHEYTAEQEKLRNQLLRFYFSEKSNKLFIINGYAGTGKTTLLSAFIKALNSKKRKTVLLAPTGRAAKVLSNKSNQIAFTIHKRIYRKEKLANGAIQLGLGPNLHKNTLFVVDEASMIPDYSMLNEGSVSSRNLLEDLINFIYQGENCSAIFLGDNAQLPPVGSDFSPALSKEYMENHYFNLNIGYSEMSEVLRQSHDSEILSNATMLRTAEPGAFPQFKIVKGVELVRLHGSILQEELESAFDKYGREETLVITRSNKSANMYNQQIRNRIFWYDERITAGDFLMVVKNNYHWLTDKKNSGFIANGEIIKVEKITRFETLYDYDFADAVISFSNYPDERLEVKLLLDTIDIEKPSLDRKEMKDFFLKVEQDYSWERNKKKRYERVMTDPYFNALQIKFSYAVTCHKSQGGQWSCVFIDHGYLTEDMLEKDYFRWMYTAFTRPTEKLYLINFHNEFFEDSGDEGF